MISAFLDQLCAVERQNGAVDSTGAMSPTWTARLSGIACTLQGYRHGKEMFTFQRDDSLAYWTIYTLVDLQATTQDRINIGGTYYAVVSYRFLQNSNTWAEPYGVTLVSRRNQ